REHDNLRAALDGCVRDDVNAGLALAAHLAPFWHMRGHHTEGRRRLEALLAAAQAPAAPAAAAAGGRRARALLALADLEVEQRDFAAARALIEAGLAAAQAAGDGDGV